MAYMAVVTSGITLLFLGSIAFLFWLAGLVEEKKTEEKKALIPHPIASPSYSNPKGSEIGGRK
jgi:hypothetical protein